MENFKLVSIGTIYNNEEGCFIKVDSKFIPALKELDGFSHINVLWWANDFDDSESRNVLEVNKPYKNSPDTLGIFATRSPLRPNPIALTTVAIHSIDYTNGLITLYYIDANNNTPLIDIKPYTPSFDKVDNSTSPSWCNHWPKSLEESSNFPWEDEFNF